MNRKGNARDTITSTNGTSAAPAQIVAIFQYFFTRGVVSAAFAASLLIFGGSYGISLMSLVEARVSPDVTC